MEERDILACCLFAVGMANNFEIIFIEHVATGSALVRHERNAKQSRDESYINIANNTIKAGIRMSQM